MNCFNISGCLCKINWECAWTISHLTILHQGDKFWNIHGVLEIKTQNNLEEYAFKQHSPAVVLWKPIVFHQTLNRSWKPWDKFEKCNFSSTSPLKVFHSVVMDLVFHSLIYPRNLIYSFKYNLNVFFNLHLLRLRPFRPLYLCILSSV